MNLFWAALSIAALHTLLPVHWLPHVTVARSNGWTVARLIGTTLVGTLIHLISTTVLTVIALLLSYGASHALGHTMERGGAGLLFVMGMVYLFLPKIIER